jgi:hypothetical protein
VFNKINYYGCMICFCLCHSFLLLLGILHSFALYMFCCIFWSYTLIFTEICCRSVSINLNIDLNISNCVLAWERITMSQDDVIKNLRSCLISCKGGIKLDNLSGKYQFCYYEAIINIVISALILFWICYFSVLLITVVSISINLN